MPSKNWNEPADVLEAGQIGGERNTGSMSNNYDVTKEECNITRITGSTETLIASAPVFLMGVIYNTTSSGTLTARDAAAISGGSAGKLVVDATRDIDTKATRFEIGLTVQGSAAGTDVSILWRPIA